MARSVKPHRASRTTERRARRRAPWAALLALVLGYACLLGISPVGQAGFLWLHLATEHHDTSVRPAAEHRHASADHGYDRYGEHGHEHAAAHEHDGRVHTHDPAPGDDPAVPVGALSEYYLSAGVKSPPLPARDATVPPSAAPAPRQAVLPIDTPPPRRPG